VGHWQEAPISRSMDGPLSPAAQRDLASSGEKSPSKNLTLSNSAEGGGEGSSAVAPPSVAVVGDLSHHVDEVVFFSGNPEIDVSTGVLKLFKDNQMDRAKSGALPPKRSDLLCLLAVPAHYNSAEICRFLRAHIKNVTYMRILRDQNPDRLMLVMRMLDQQKADEFYLEYNGVRFNSVEPERCKVAFLSAVEFLEPRDAELLTPVAQHEMPTCPVCLERLEEQTSGIYITLCNHTFHCNCLAQWNSDSSCPVCRYTLKTSDEQASKCDDCDTVDSLWICLICGHVGCSRYRKSHAQDHWKTTGHTYALELDTQRVWDYAGDGYVHRLIQNKSDGKVVELPSPSQVTDFREPEKIQKIVTEYNFLLTSQLEAQRAYYEDLLQKASVTGGPSHESAGGGSGEVRQLSKANAQLHTQVGQLKAKMLDLIKENQGLRDFNAALESDRKRWQSMLDKQAAENAALSKKMEDLNEQLRDLMFFVEAQKAIATNQDALEEGGKVTVPKDAVPKPPKTSGGKKKKK
jgi:BRCA1-associated protein